MKRIFELEKEHEARVVVTTSSAQAPTHPLTRSDIPVTTKVSLVFSCQGKSYTRTIIVGVGGYVSPPPVNNKRDQGLDNNPLQEENSNKQTRVSGETSFRLIVSNIGSSSPLLKLSRILPSWIPHTP